MTDKERESLETERATNGGGGRYGAVSLLDDEEEDPDADPGPVPFSGDGDFSSLSLMRIPFISRSGGDDANGDADYAEEVAVPLNSTDRTLRKTRSSFWEDARTFREGTVPQSLVLALAIGLACGVAAFLYYEMLFFFLDFLWKDLPKRYVEGIWPQQYEVLWIPLVGFTMAVFVGLSVVLLGEPGDLAYTVKCVHDKAYISTSHVLPMLVASLFSILGGGSLGPEAPLVAICAAVAGYISRRVFKQRNRNVVRKHTLMGMAGALAAFFGCPLGGSLFALEVNSRFGVEYFEHTVEAIFCGEVCLVVYRFLSGQAIEAIWEIDPNKLGAAYPRQVVVGAVIGLLGAGVAAVFAAFHWRVMDAFGRMGLLDNKRAVKRALLGAVVVVGLGMSIPQTMFW